MATQVDLSTMQSNDTQLALSVVSAGSPLSLAGVTLKFVLKASSTATDASGTSFTIGSGLTITNSLNGDIVCSIPAAQLAASGTMWWRLDITSGTGTATALFGHLYILAC